MAEFWGYHLILDISSCEVDKIKDSKNILKFMKTLVDKIHMKAFEEPVIHHFASHNPNVTGYSVMQLIETSSITGHFVDKNGDAYIDIFSCKDFSIEVVKELVQEYFHPKKIKVIFLNRQA
jgi:S-adenosylmethionine decarboxylase